MAFTVGNDNINKIYTGLANCSVVTINPNEEQLVKMGKESKKPLNYVETLTDSEGNPFKRVCVDFWLSHTNPDILVKVRFFLTNVIKKNIAGDKTRFINDYGQNFYGLNSEDIPVNSSTNVAWISPVGIRECYTGEAELIDFIRVWFSSGPKDVSKLDNINKLFEGDFSELHNYTKIGKDKKVQVLLYEKDGFTNVYTKHFARAFNKKPDFWVKSLEKSTVMINYQNTFALKEYDPINDASPAPVSNDSPSNEDPFV